MNLQISVDSRDAMNLLRRAPVIFDQALETAANDAVTDLHVQMQTYPRQQFRSYGTAYSPVRFTTKGGKEVDFLAKRHAYKRRNILRASWIKKVSRSGGIIRGEVASSGAVAPYNKWVQSAEYQAGVHRGIWLNTDQSVMERSQQRIEGYFRTRISRAVATLTT